MDTVEFDYHFYGINGEPEHNTDSIFCWCAPTLTPDGVMVHKSMAEIISNAIHCAAKHATEPHPHAEVTGRTP